MLRLLLQRHVESAVSSLIETERLSDAVRGVAIEIQDTRNPDHGDYACNFAMVSSKLAGQSPRAIGELLKEALLAPPNSEDLFVAIDVAGPGFLNFRIQPTVIASYVPEILNRGLAIAQPEAGSVPPLRVNVEFVSVNPNGPITVGSGRGAAFGDTLSRVLAACGHQVDREYYINDGVNSEQMRLFAESVKFYVRNALGLNAEFPEKGYRGEYVQDVGLGLLRQVIAETTARQRALADIMTAMEVDPALASYEKFEALRAEISTVEAAQAHYDSVKAQEDEAALVARILLDILHLDSPPTVENFERLLLLELVTPSFVEEDNFDPSNSAWEGRMRSFLQIAKGERGLPEEQEAAIHVAEQLRQCLSVQDADLWDTSHFQQAAQSLMIDRQRQDLAAFEVEFQRWFSEQSLHDEGKVAAAVAKMEADGVAYRSLTSQAVVPSEEGAEAPVPADADEDEATDGSGEAIWLASTRFGDDKDRVLIRADGRPAYVAADVAYLADKLTTRAYDRSVLILGPDHHGYIGRMYAVYQALGYPLNAKGKPSRFEIIIFQIVRFVKDGKPAPMRKRDGNIYELRDLIDELGRTQAPNGTPEEQRQVGADVARFFYLMRSHDTHMDFDIDLATKQSDENPVFYAQYAHARICSVLRKAEETEGLDLSGEIDAATLGYLQHPRELALIKKVLDLSTEVERCGRDYGVHRLTTFAVELARIYHHFYDVCRVIQLDQPELSRARVALCRAAAIGLKATFNLLGVSAPERMDRTEAAAV